MLHLFHFLFPFFPLSSSSFSLFLFFFDYFKTVEHLISHKIGNISVILLIFCQYFIDILLIFFDNILLHARMVRTLDISTIYQHFSIYRRNIDDIIDISSIFATTDFRLPISY